MKMPKIVFRLVVFSCFCVFAARGIQHYFYDAPFRILVWDENLMKPILEQYFRISWEAWTLNLENEEWIVKVAKVVGLFYGFSALISLLFLTKLSEKQWFKYFGNFILIIGFLNLFLLYFLYSKDKSYRPTEFLEYALQWGSPLLLIFYNKFNINVLKTLCAAVFISHGLYALGVYQTPVSYYNMTMNILGCSQPSAKQFLIIAGVLDIVFSVGLFWKKTFKISVFYMVLWGGLTTIARLYGNWYLEMWELSIKQYFHEMLVRFPHLFLPLSLFYVEKITKFRT